MNYSELPQTRYAMSGDVSIAYQTMGDGPIDIIAIPGAISHVEFLHEMPGIRRSCNVFQNSPASSPLTSVARDCRTRYQALPCSKSAWMTFELSWTPLARNVLPCLDFPRVAQ